MMMEEQSKNTVQRKKKNEQVWSWRDIRDDIASSFIFELTINLLLFIPRAILRILRNL